MATDTPTTESSRESEDPSFDRVLEAKRILLRHRIAAEGSPTRYPVRIGYVPMKTGKRILLVISTLLVLLMGAVGICAVWEILNLEDVSRVILTSLIIFSSCGCLLAANYYCGPVEWQTAEELQNE